MKVIKLKPGLSDEEVVKLKGAKLTEEHFDLVINYDCKVLKPDGSLLFVFRRNIIPNNLCKIAYDELRHLSQPPTNRGIAALGQQIPAALMKDGEKRSKTKHINHTLLKLTGLKDASSAVIGFYDRYVRFPYCRQTAFNLNHPDKFKKVLPFIRAVDAAFKENVPDRYEVQMARVRETSPDFVISKTAFTTVTVNKNWQTAVHTDKGDYEPGFGVLSALCAGEFKGCYYTFPRYRIAVDLRTTDVIFADVHEPHGNSPLYGVKGQFERVSCVFYYREKMNNCGSAKQELKRAKLRKAGDPIYDR